MMNFREQDWRNRRSLLNQGMNFPPMHYTIANYCTDHKSDLNTPFAQEDLLTKLHSIPDPLKKNLADSVIGIEEKNNKNKGMPPNTKDYYQPNMESEAETTPMVDKSDAYPSLTGITTFIANFFGAISGAMFQRRAKSPVRYYDCFEPDPDRRERAPPSWQASKYEDQNKNGAPEFSTDPLNDNMNKNCRDAVFKCEGKLNAVRDLLLNKSEPCKPKYRRKPRKLFVEPGSVEERFEDAFTPEDFVSLSSEQYIKCNGITNNHQEDLCEADGPKIKTEIGYVQENDIIKAVPEIEEKIKTSVNETKVPTEDRMKPTIVEDVIPTTITEEIIGLAEPTTKTNIQEDCVQKVTGDSKPEIKAEIILSCEDKMAKLKSLLQEKRKNKKIVPDLTVTAPKPVKEDERPKKPSKNIPIEKVTDKHFKNPNRISVDKRKRSKLRKNIQDDILFANEIDSEDISLNNSPSVSTIPEMEEEDEKEYFDEVRGRFQPSSVTDSEDSFQIVFSDSPKSRSRKPSDCDSEDSFIVFEDSPDSCYTSNDVFGDVTESDIESDSEVSDSGVSEICKMSHTFSRTVSDLTDDSLYNDNRECDNDEVDCAVRWLDEIAVPEVPEVEPVKPGLLINEAKKLQRKGQPSKSVSFSSKPPKVHIMRVWAFAARQARAGHWERHALDRERFKRRIADVDMAVSWVLKPQHRSRVMFQRFMPWRNAQRRKEIAEKKLREEEERLRKEEERLLLEKDEELIALRRDLENQDSVLKALENVTKIINGEKVVNGNDTQNVKQIVKTRNKTETVLNGHDKNQNDTQTDKQLQVSDKLDGTSVDNVKNEVA